MLKQTVFRTGSAVLIMTLGACTWFQQPAAPVESGTNNTTTAPTTEQSNPYGAAPYTPTSALNAPEPHTPPVSTGTNVDNVDGTYIPSNAPVDINAATHTVVRGDTVYNISKRYHLNQDDLRSWNNLVDNTISVDQILRVKPAGYVAPATAATVTTTAAAPSATTKTESSTPAKTAMVSGVTRSVAGITWQSPTSGNIIAKFGGANKGIDIAGNAGQAVVSAADGKVVYAGSGLRGYGNLVIVQHNQTYLTAYGHNQSLLVKEGQNVKRGQTIARMGNSDADHTKLHFEVRRNGTPVNPIQYIPF